MSSLYLRGQTWWAKSLEQGQVVRWSLKTTSKTEAKRSNCLVCQGAPLLIDRHLLGLPRRMMFHHGVQDRQQLAHAGGQGHLCRLPCRPQALVEGLEHRIIPDRHQGTHVQSGPHMGASSPDRPAAPERAAIPVQRGHPDQAASRWRLNVPNSGRSSSSVRAQTGPMPGTLRSSSSRSRHTGLVRSVVSRSSSSAASRVLSQVIWAWMSVCSRGGAFPDGSVRPSAWPPVAAAAPAGRGVRRLGHPAGAEASAAPPRQNGPRRARRAHPSWPTARSLWQSHAPGED